jgi:hypothetical protein
MGKPADSADFEFAAPIDAGGPEIPEVECEPGSERARRAASLSRILRGIGAASLIAAASTFLLQNWETGGDLERYFTLLAHTGLLAAVGFVWGLRSGDRKGARTFLAIAAGLVPVQFCILGGLVYSKLSWDGPLTPVAAYATWVAPSAGAALATAAATLALTAPVVLLAFLALARSRARLLAAAYVGANATLLLPTRDPSVVAALAGVLLALLAAIEVRAVRGDTALRTLEGVLVRSMLFAPAVLLLARSLLHYELSALYHAVVCGAATLAITALAAMPRIPERWRERLHSLSLVPTAGAIAFVTFALMEGPGLADRFAIPVGSLLYAGAVTALSLLAGEAPWGSRFRRSAAGVAVAGMGVNLLLFPGAFASIACLVAAIATLSYGFLMERRALLAIGAAGVLCAGAYHLQQALTIYAYSQWGSLAILGVIVILAASVLERHWGLLVERATLFRRRFARRFAGWE